MDKTTVPAVAKILFDAGILSAWQYYNTRRIVIDLDINKAPIIYFESFVDEALLEVFTSLEGIQIKGVNRDSEPGVSEEAERSTEELRKEPEAGSPDRLPEYDPDDWPGSFRDDEGNDPSR